MPDMEVVDGTDSSSGQAYHQPHLRQLLATLGLEVAFHRGDGVHLYYRDRDHREVEVLDLVGGYGASLFGHANPAIVKEATCWLASQSPVLAQGSIRPQAEDLARELAGLCGGNYHAVFANSGAEAVEAAIKHAMLQTSGSTFIALEGAFHGKTLGAVQLTGNPEYREPFGCAAFDVVRVQPNDVAALDAAFKPNGNLAGMFIEPIQGEGGVRALTTRFTQRSAELCRAAGIPLIADECQTGMGRTGRFLASAALGIAPDYVLLSKSLGGGLAKIAVALIRADHYRNEFDLKHTSTFAADDFSSAIARRAVRLLTRDVLRDIEQQGEYARSKLRELAARFPDVIADVRGAGLMLGLEFQSQRDSNSFLLRLFSSRDELVQAIAAHLFHRHRLRVAPTLSDPWTLRLQPACTIQPSHWTQLLVGIEDVCERLQRGDAFGLTDYVVDKCVDQAEPRLLRLQRTTVGVPASAGLPDPNETAEDRLKAGLQQSQSTFDGSDVASLLRGRASKRIGWLCHMIDADDLLQQENEAGAMGFEMVEQYLSRWSPLASPVVMNAVDVESVTGERVCLVPIMLPVTSRMMKRWLDRREFALCRGLIAQGVGAAQQLDCKLVALGQYTSIVTRAGASLRPDDPIGLTSGNSYAIALACKAVDVTLKERGNHPSRLVLAIAGSLGNIGSACVEILAPAFAETILVGRPRSTSRLKAQARHLLRASISTSLADLQRADVVISAVNAVNSPIESEHLAPGAIVCDLSVPASISQATRQLRPDVTVIRGGIAQLPCGEDLGIASFPLPRGITFACMAEGLLLGFEDVFDRSFTGALSPTHIRRISAMANKHGFTLSEHQADCVFGSERRESSYATR